MYTTNKPKITAAHTQERQMPVPRAEISQDSLREREKTDCRQSPTMESPTTPRAPIEKMLVPPPQCSGEPTEAGLNQQAAIFQNHANELSRQTLTSTPYGRDIYSGRSYHLPLWALIKDQQPRAGIDLAGLGGLRGDTNLLTIPVQVHGHYQTTPVSGANGVKMHRLIQNRGTAPDQKPGQALMALLLALPKVSKGKSILPSCGHSTADDLHRTITEIAATVSKLATSTPKSRKIAGDVLKHINALTPNDLKANQEQLESITSRATKAIAVHRARSSVKGLHAPTTEDALELIYPLPLLDPISIPPQDQPPTKEVFLKIAATASWESTLLVKSIQTLVQALPESIFEQAAAEQSPQRGLLQLALNGFANAINPSHQPGGPMPSLSTALPLDEAENSHDIRSYLEAIDSIAALLQAFKPFTQQDWNLAVHQHVLSGFGPRASTPPALAASMGTPIWSTHGIAALNIAKTAAPENRLVDAKLGDALYYELLMQSAGPFAPEEREAMVDLSRLDIPNQPPAYEQVLVAGRCAETEERQLPNDLRRLEASLFSPQESSGRKLLILDTTLEPMDDVITKWVAKKEVIAGIENEKLDIILIKSLQKYTTLGSGKTTGAYLLPLSKGGAKSALNRFFCAHHLGSGTSPLKAAKAVSASPALGRSAQIQTLFLKTGLEKEFYEAAAENAQRIADKIGPGARAKGPFVFVLSNQLMRHLGPVWVGDIPLLPSESFGSLVTTATRIPSTFGIDTYIRISPGITKAAIEKFASIQINPLSLAKLSDSFSKDDWGYVRTSSASSSSPSSVSSQWWEELQSPSDSDFQDDD